jgi:hypothetical protein
VFLCCNRWSPTTVSYNVQCTLYFIQQYMNVFSPDNMLYCNSCLLLTKYCVVADSRITVPDLVPTIYVQQYQYFAGHRNYCTAV